MSDHLAAIGLTPGDRGRCSGHLVVGRCGRASATSLVVAGVDVKTAQAVLGHSDARLTLDPLVRCRVGRFELPTSASRSLARRTAATLDGPDRRSPLDGKRRRIASVEGVRGVRAGCRASSR